MTTSPADWLRGLPSLTGTPPDPDPAAVPDDPETLFVEWIVGAVQAGVPEPHAMTLATVDAEGAPDARTVILKDVGSRGWAFAGHRASRKAEQLAARPVAALDFWWQPVMRAVRVRGSVVQADAADGAADLAARSPAARDGIAPEDWLLWRLVPDRVEFWQGAVDRRHLRLVYERAVVGWTHRIATGHTEPHQSGERLA